MDVIARLNSALDETVRIVSGIRPDQMHNPTPCAQWDVRQIIDHLVTGNLRLAARARGETPSDLQGDILDSDPATLYMASVAELEEAWRDPAAMERRYELPFGVLPAPAVLALRTADVVTHGWDLAQATGQVAHFDPEVIDAALTFAEQNLARARGVGAPFAESVSIGPDAAPIDRLAAFLGREPETWSREGQ